MAALITISVLLAVVVTGGALWIGSISDRLDILDSEGNLVNLDLTNRKAEEPYYVLILGYDKDEWDSSRSDTIMLARVDEKLGKVWLVSIPRDLKVEIPGNGEDKINAAYNIGGPGLTVRTVEDLTGLPIHYYIGLELDGFVQVVDAMGGIEIDVPMDIDAGGETWEQAISAGPQVLDGYQALWFVRTREFEEGDLSRVHNQQIFLKAVADQASDTPITRLISLVNAASNMVETNMSLTELGRMTNQLRSIGSTNMYTATIPVDFEDPYVVAIEPDFTELIRKLNTGEPIGIEELDEGVDQTSDDHDYFEGGTYNPVPTDVSIDIRNGSDRSGLAAQASTLLQSAGFAIGEIGNVQNPGSYTKTYVVYKDNPASGKLVASHLQPGVEVRASNGAYTFDGDVLIVIGSDWDLERVPVSQN